MEQLGVSAIHPTAPQFLSAVLLSHEEIDLERGIGRLNSLWKVGAEPVWDQASDGSELLHFSVAGAQVMLTQLSGSFTPRRGALPPHSYYTAITLFLPDSGDDGVTHNSGDPSARASASSSAGADAAAPAAQENAHAVARRRQMVTAHILLTQLADALGRAPGVIGLFREELGVVQPPQMFDQLAPLLTQGQVPLPLWVNIRVQPLAAGNAPTAGTADGADTAALARADGLTNENPDGRNLGGHETDAREARGRAADGRAVGGHSTDGKGAGGRHESGSDAAPALTLGRTFGLPLFGHLDLQVSESVHSPEEVYAELANIASYLITGDSYLLPGQTLGSSAGEQIALTQTLSEIDHTPVIEVLY